MDRKKQMKNSIKLFCSYFEEIYNSRGKGVFLETTDRMYEKITSKELIMNFRNKPKSKNIDRFISHRTKVQKSTIDKFKNGVRIPYVFPLFTLPEKNQKELKNLQDIVIQHSFVQLGCHNIADRISISNPKKFKSVRTMFSFPHYGIQKEIKKETKGEWVEQKFNSSFDNISMNRRIIDNNGKVWINHSINAIKDGSEWKMDFPDEGNDVKPITKKGDYSDEFWDKFGNDVFVDIDKLNFQNLGSYHTFDYQYLDEFDFEDFNEEELNWVSEWLDYEWIGLTMGDNNESQASPLEKLDVDGLTRFYPFYVECLKEVGEEIGWEKLTPIVDIGYKTRVKMKLGSGVRGMALDSNYLESGMVCNLIDSIENNYKIESKKMEGILEKVSEGDIPDGLLRIKRKNYYERLLNTTWDYDNNKLFPPQKRGASLGSIMRANTRIQQRTQAMKESLGEIGDFVEQMMKEHFDEGNTNP
jgi:hypothetical protein